MNNKIFPCQFFVGVNNASQQHPVTQFTDLAFKAINNRSVIDAIYMIASYTYGPLLGLFVFGLFTKKHPRDKFVPYICIVSPLLCFLTDYLVKQHTGYAFGYEMLMLNGAITFGGLWLSSIGNGQLTIRKKSINT